MFKWFKKTKEEKDCCGVKIEEVKPQKLSCCNVKIEEVKEEKELKVDAASSPCCSSKTE
ncbi:MAG: hypothetical protein ACI35O_10200 [Bacillaceae bacterium]